MKYLENEKLTHLTSELTNAVLRGTQLRVIHGRIEAYTMKRAGTDKKYAHALGERFVHEIEVEERTRNEAGVAAVAKFQKLIGGGGGDVDGGGSETALPPTSTTTTTTNTNAGGTTTKSNSRMGRRRSKSVGSEPQPKSLKLYKSQSRRVRSSSFDHSGRPTVPPSTSGGAGGYYTNSPLGDFHHTQTRRLMTDLILTLNASFPDYDFGTVRPDHFIKLPSSYTAVNRINERLSEFAATTSKGHGFLPKLWNAIDDVIVLEECDVYSYVGAPEDGGDEDEALGFLIQTLAPNDEEDEGEVGGGGSGEVAVVENLVSTVSSLQEHKGGERRSEEVGRGGGGNKTSLSSSSISNVMLWSFNYFFVNKGLKRIVYFPCVQTMQRNNDNSGPISDNDEDDWNRSTLRDEETHSHHHKSTIDPTTSSTSLSDIDRIQRRKRRGDYIISSSGYSSTASGYYSAGGMTNTSGGSSDMEFDTNNDDGTTEDVAGGVAAPTRRPAPPPRSTGIASG